MRPLPRLLLACAAASIGLGRSPARAEAWLLGPGAGQIIATARFVKGGGLFDARGRLVPQAGYRKCELPALVSYGVTERITVFMKPTFTRLEPAAGAPGSGVASTEIGGRVRVWGGGAQVISLQGMARLPGLGPGDSPPALTEKGVGFEGKLLWGRSATLLGRPAFAEIGLAYRTRPGRAADEIRLDGTVGLFLHPRLALLVQSFNAASAGPAPTGAYQSSRLGASLLVPIGAYTLQAGFEALVAGRNVTRDRALVLGLWRPF